MELQALNALDEIKCLLHLEREASKGPHKQKQYMESKVNRWSKKIFKTYSIYSLAKIWTQKEDGPWHLNRWYRLRDKQQRMHQRDFEIMHRNLFQKRNHQKILMAYGSTHRLMLMKNSHRKFIYTFNQKENTSRLTTVYLNQIEIQVKWGITKSIGKLTAKHWMKKLGYLWVQNHKGWYVDGHKREDIVKY